MVMAAAYTAPSQGAVCPFSLSSRFVAFAPSKALKRSYLSNAFHAKFLLTFWIFILFTLLSYIAWNTRFSISWLYLFVLFIVCFDINCRREVCIIQSAYGTSPKITMSSIYPRFYHSFYHGRTSSVGKLYYKLMTDSSPAKMIPYYRDQNSFEGKPSKEIFNRQKVDKRREQVSRNCSSTSVQEVGHNSPHRPHISSTATVPEKNMPSTLKWDEEIERLQKTKAEVYARILPEGRLYFQEIMGSRQITSQNYKLLDKPGVEELPDTENVAANDLNSKNLAVSKPALTEPNGTGNRNKALDLVNLQTPDDSTKESSDSKGPLTKETKAKPQDLRHRLTSIYKNVVVVDNISAAKKVVKMLTQQYRHLVHACDTEVAKIDVKQETPVDHGEVICFSIYSGPQADFGDGKSCLWIDVLDGGRDLLIEFAPFFEDPSIKKHDYHLVSNIHKWLSCHLAFGAGFCNWSLYQVWHNYSFDNHVIENYGFKVSGFHADTMHMARLWNSSRRTEGGYSLEALTGDQKVMSEVTSCQEKDLFGKVSMKTIFGRRKVKKDGSEGKMITLPPVEELQRQERKSWICYSALDAISTLKLYESLQNKLSKMYWKLDGKLVQGETMFDFYQKYWRPFGEILIKMETEGMLVDRPYLAEIEKVAKAEQEDAVNRFRNWAIKYCPDAKYMNVGK
ncbi:hypothetical protein Pint_04190 [Pistacia integerrima]|uniref:Uncharacterized protein n=1 Tax=Pistacia integerrima TaxID=434235 RepID=A0ACC0ZAU7_9ROSI|nr:hypothetical protein Pint_04190 [Pistacia integerrima]